MSWDVLGQLFGKAKRRDLEAQAAGLVKPLQVALPVIGSRLAAVGLASIVGDAVKNGIPHNAQAAAVVASGALTAVMLAAPDAFQASGLVRSVSPGTASLLEAAGTTVKAVLAAPANARKAAFSQAVQDEVEKALTGQFISTPQGLVPVPTPQTPAPAPQSAPAASVGAQATIPEAGSGSAALDSEAGSDPAVKATGGNQ